MSSRSSGTAGENTVAQLLAYEGWTIERQVIVGDHRIDMVGVHPEHPETLFEVKVWADPTRVGTDTVKKAIADAYDLREAGEERPYVLVLSHHLSQTYRNMLARALKAGAISEVRIIGFTDFQP
jgi:hypothetical protein